MASQVTRDEVARIAGLAQLDLSAAELDTFARQLTDILTYAAIVQQADTTEVANSTSGSRNFGAPARPDIPVPSLDRDDVLAQAPDAASETGLFRVPKVL